MHYVEAYISLLMEVVDDIVAAFESETTRGFMIAALVLIPIFGSMFFFAVLVNAAEYLAPAPTVNIEAAQRTDNTIDILLSDNTGPINAAEVELQFDPSYIYVSDLTIAPELCEERFVITKVIDNEIGRIFYQCGTVTPFTGTSTVLATLEVTPLALGTSTLSFATSSTNILAHDGYGSNVTKQRLDGLYAFGS